MAGELTGDVTQDLTPGTASGTPELTETSHEPRVPIRLVALKHGDTFIVADSNGDILGEGDGLFQNDTRILSRWPDARALSYGHMGDSNLHLVVNVPSCGADQPAKEIKAMVYGLTRDLGGTVSAEHGIGTIKRDVIGYSRSPAELATMRTIKAALDPRGILNPGKGFA